MTATAADLMRSVVAEASIGPGRTSIVPVS